MTKANLRLVSSRALNGTVPPRRVPNAELRTREYLDEFEVERLMRAAKANRHGQRDSTMILIAFRHGLRAAELVDLRWDQVDLGRNAVLHVRRVKNGMPSVHPLQGDETKIWLGEPDIAIEHLAIAMRLSPLDPFIHHRQSTTALAHFCAGRYDEACMWGEKSLQGGHMSGYRIAAASNALVGRIEKAQKIAARFHQLDPGFRVSSMKDNFPFRRPEDLARYEDGLRKAGLPE